MPNISEGLTGGGVESDPTDVNTEAGFNAAVARAAQAGTTRAESPQAAEPPAERPRGKNAPHYRGSPTGEGSGRPVPLTPEQQAAFLEGPSTSIEGGLSVGRPGDQEPKTPSADEIRAEARARYEQMKRNDPGWAEFERRQREQGAARAQTAGEVTELRIRQIADALEDGDGPQALALGARLKRENPSAYRALQEQWMDAEIDEYHEAGWDDFDEAQGDAFRFDQEVQALIDRDDAARKLAHSARMIEGLTERNVQTYSDRLAEAGLLPDANDEASIERYESLSEWIAESIGVSPAELIQTNPAEAAELVVRADAQLQQFARDAALHSFHKSILEADTGTVSEGMTSGVETTNAKLDQLIDTIRAASGLEPANAPKIPTFDPNLDIAPSPQEVDDPPISVGEFKRALVEDAGEPYGRGAFTQNGKPVSFSEASRDKIREEEARLAAVARAGVLR